MAMQSFDAAAAPMHAAKPLLDRNPIRAQRLIGSTIVQRPDLCEAYFNLGLAFHQQGRLPAAIRSYRRALTCCADCQLEGLVARSARRNLAQDLLLHGAFREGWALYEERLDRQNHDFFHNLFGRPWQGIWDERPLSRLLLVAEQGLGDTLMFCRLGIQLQIDLNVPVTLFCQKPLVALLQQGTALDTVTASVNHDPSHDASVRWCPLMSVPLRVHLQPSTLTRQAPYLTLPTNAIQRWQKLLGRNPEKQLIALHWQGNPRHEGSLYSQGRSIPFSELQALGTLSGVEFVSIQKGAGSEQLRLDGPLRFVEGQAAVSASMDFIDTAAVLANCDLLISADSGVVHLAGALGLPAWVALRHVPEWRWGLHGERSPWYPSLRLFRQPSHGDWNSVMEALLNAWQQKVLP
ncbi:glycosyltransferase family 9 protein [Synechococcus sp. CS-197]|uniref:glycosyltransferase family 9 protein n=1 Tax=Synechococcus sp. CS-197 TaxID=2847985 RepID=UPI0001525C67|nr:glycosyltransferase family 9 protein [Synechococcus sp. CS-197]CAK22542.1 Conserved hypothetical protein with TPR repeat, possibly involved in cell envelope biogenesis [Synechococcus sp. WH 7803]